MLQGRKHRIGKNSGKSSVSSMDDPRGNIVGKGGIQKEGLAPAGESTGKVNKRAVRQRTLTETNTCTVKTR